MLIYKLFFNQVIKDKSKEKVFKCDRKKKALNSYPLLNITKI